MRYINSHYITIGVVLCAVAETGGGGREEGRGEGGGEGGGQGGGAAATNDMFAVR